MGMTSLMTTLVATILTRRMTLSKPTLRIWKAWKMKMDLGRVTLAGTISVTTRATKKARRISVILAILTRTLKLLAMMMARMASAMTIFERRDLMLKYI